MKEVTIGGKGRSGREFLFASDLDTQTRVWFEAAQVAAVIPAEGRLAFLDGEGEPFAQAELPGSEDGRGVYQNVKCAYEEDAISLLFPLYRWIDHYPHCDGEHDRWSAVISGWYTVRLELSARAVRQWEERR